jgi:DNA-binding response OmpR family regulator
MQQRVLLVDDEVDVLEWVSSLLESWDYEVQTSCDGFEAIQLARATKPDLILLDVGMDPMSGPEVCEKVKQDYVTRSNPVILLTVHDQLRRKVEGLTRGADDYVVKTVDPLELKARIETVVRRTEEQSNANPLTKLPGNVAIDREVARRLDSRERFSVCYCDIDNSKSYNDRYAVNNVGKQFESPHIIAERAAEKKKYLKQFEGSHYLSDHRGTERTDWRRRIEAHRQKYLAKRRKAVAARPPRQSLIAPPPIPLTLYSNHIVWNETALKTDHFKG